VNIIVVYTHLNIVLATKMHTVFCVFATE